MFTKNGEVTVFHYTPKYYAEYSDKGKLHEYIEKRKIVSLTWKLGENNEVIFKDLHSSLRVKALFLHLELTKFLESKLQMQTVMFITIEAHKIAERLIQQFAKLSWPKVRLVLGDDFIITHVKIEKGKRGA